jgi:hypothetical protein
MFALYRRFHRSVVATVLRGIGILAVLFIVAHVAISQEPEPPKQSWKRIEEPVKDKLSPLYLDAAKKIEEILDGKRQCVVLPRAIRDVKLTRDGMPCFEMHAGSWDTRKSGEAYRWAAEQTWGGRFRLFYNAELLDIRDEMLLIRPYDKSVGLLKYDGQTWTEYSMIKRRQRKESLLGTDGKVFGIIDEQVHHYEDGKWVADPVRADRKENVLLSIFRSNARGQLLAFVQKFKSSEVELWFHDGKSWSSETIPRNSWVLRGLTLCDNGKIVVRVDRHKAMVLSPLESEPAENGEGKRWKRKIFDFEQASLPERPKLSSEDMVVDPRNAKISFVALSEDELPKDKKFPGRSRGFPYWIGNPGEEVIFRPKGGAIVAKRWLGLGWFDETWKKVHMLKGISFRKHDTLLGCDKNDIVYVRQGMDGSILAYSLQAPPESWTKPDVVSEYTSDSNLRDSNLSRFSWDLTQVAVDTEGVLWYISPTQARAIMTLQEYEKPRVLGDEYEGVESLWPGRDGSMLVLYQNRRAALVRKDQPALFEESLAKLCEKHFEAMRKAAPRNPYNKQRFMAGLDVMSSRMNPCPAPWMATEKTLWIADLLGGRVMRFAEDDLQGRVVTNESHCLLGRLGDGAIVLGVCRKGWLHYRFSKWSWIEDPDGKATVRSFDEKRIDRKMFGHVGVPGKPRQNWLCTEDGTLYFAGKGSQDTICLRSPKKWKRFKQFDCPGIEYPANTVWGYHFYGVFPGWEVVGPEGRHSSLITYRENLTPLFGEKDDVYCLTPVGLAAFPYKKGLDAKARYQYVAFPDCRLSDKGEIGYIGRHKETLFFLLRVSYGSKIIAIDCELFPDETILP